MKQIGIYKITNTKTGAFYIGSSINVKKRWGTHRCELKKGIHHSPYLQRSYNKHGAEAFLFEIILNLDCDKNLLTWEQIFIDLLRPAYNFVKTAGNCKGRLMSDKTREILRKAATGNKYNLGRKHTEETKQKISEKILGMNLQMSDSNKEKRRAAWIGNKLGVGRKISEETREKLKTARKRVRPVRGVAEDGSEIFFASIAEAKRNNFMAVDQSIRRGYRCKGYLFYYT